MMAHFHPWCTLLLTLPLVSCGSSSRPSAISSSNEKAASSLSQQGKSLEDDSSSIEYVPYVFREKTSYKVMFIGNSFTKWYYDIPAMVESFGKELGLSISCTEFTKGSQRLYQSADSSDEVGAMVQKEIDSASDYTDIVLQEQSTLPYQNKDNGEQSYFAGFKALRDKIGAKEEEADFHVYATWAYESFRKSMGFSSIPKAEARLRKIFEEAGERFGAGVDEVGQGFSEIYEDQENNGIANLYHSDSKHPGFAGACLSAMIHLGAITGADVRSLTMPEDPVNDDFAKANRLSEEGFTTLKNLAYRINGERK